MGEVKLSKELYGLLKPVKRYWQPASNQGILYQTCITYQYYTTQQYTYYLPTLVEHIATCKHQHQKRELNACMWISLVANSQVPNGTTRNTVNKLQKQSGTFARHNNVSSVDFTIRISKFLLKRSQSDGCCGGDHYYLVLFTVTSDLFPRGHNVPPTICSDYTRISFFLCFYLFHSKLFVLCNEDRRRILIARVDVVFICVIASCIQNIIYILTTVNNVETFFVFSKQVFVYFHCSLILPDFN